MKKKSEPQITQITQMAQMGTVAKDVTATVPDEPFEVGEWNGHVQWRCRLCPWDTLKSEAAMREHLAARHAPKVEQPVKRLVQAYDARGNPIDI